MNKRERIIAFNKATKTTHGHAVDGKYTKTYYCYHSMIQRCCNPKNKNYPRYGAKGITVCDRWQESFENFLEDMGEVPKGLSIERIEVKGNYEPSNCKWATVKEQANNRTTNTFITYQGRTQTIAQWAEELGINYSTLCSRLYGHGWSVEKALTTPVRIRKKAAA